MKQKSLTFKKTLIKIAIIIVTLLIVIIFLFSLFYFGCFSNFSKVKFDADKLKFASAEIETFDKNDNLIQGPTNTRNLVKLNELNQYTIDSFITIEDKDFYSHKGINYKRILKATLNNIKSHSFKEGASTISQQLIKNTHLTNEKTLKRKLNELLLTQKLEKNFTKDEILQAYLNVIYFGSSTFGLEEASQKYYSKSAKDLTISESATLAGLIKSPKKYSPIINPVNAINRRNLVLTQLYKNKKISSEDFNIAINEDLNLKINPNATNTNTYYTAAIEEACEILNITEKDLILDNYKVYTYLDEKTQENLYSAINDKTLNPKTNINDSLGIIIENKTGGITGYYGKSKFNLREIKRQPGSAIKPILVYAPALDTNVITPATPILDEKFTIDDYTPTNYKDKYYGWISAKTALAKSLNVPAVKILSYVGIDKAKEYCKNFGIELSSEDTGYSLALGGLTNGITPLQLANSYQTIANFGKFKKATFIRKIVNKYGRTVYENTEYSKKVLREDTSYLLTKMLTETVSNGTSKKLSDLAFETAAKTGTVGDKHQKNTDIWNLSYNSDQTVCIWLGNTSQNKENNFEENETGANYPTNIAKEIYKISKPSHKNFTKPDSVVEKNISTIDLNNNVLKLSNKNTPDRFKKIEIFSIYNQPKEETDLFKKSINDNFCIVGACIDNTKTSITFTPKSYYFYDIIRKQNNTLYILASYSNKSGNITYVDDATPTNTICEYFVVEKFSDKEFSLLNEDEYNKSNIFKTYILK